MKKHKLLGILFVMALVLAPIALLRPGVIYRFIPPLGRREVIKWVFKDQQIFDAMMNSPQVTAQRLHMKDDDNWNLLSGYTRDAPVPITVDQARQLKNLLRKPSSYLWNVQSCMPDYGVVFNFQSGGHSVHVALCLKCNIIGVFDGDNDASNRVNFTSQFDPMRGQIVTLSKTLFPNDSELQALK